jgi:hypothetical protein
VIQVTGEKDRPQDEGQGLAFGAPVESNGTTQASMTAHIVIMPGGVMLIDEALNLDIGKPVSGPIHCNNGRD